MNVKQIDWPSDVPKKLLKACGSDVETIKAEVQSGVCHLYKLESDAADLYIVTRGEETPTRKELVIVCAAGHGMEGAGQLLIDNAKRLGFDSIRYHSKASVHRLYSSYGFGGNEIERVYRLNVGGECGQ